MDRLLLHIGLPKAASTLLQREVFPSLVGNGVQFKGKTSTGGWADPGLWRHVRDYSLAGRCQARPDAIAEVAGTRGTAIFSSEDFLNPFGFRTNTLIPETVGSFERLDRAMALMPASAEVMILVVIRRQDDWLASFHFECLKQGYFAHRDLRAFWRFLSDETPWVSEVLDFDALDRSLRARYPGARISMIPLEGLGQSAGASLREAFAFLGRSKAAEPVAAMPLNKRQTSGTRALFAPSDMRFMRRRIARQVLQPRMPVAERLARLRLLGSLHGGALRRGLPMTCETLLPDLMAGFWEANLRLSRRVGSLHDLREHGYLESLR